MLSEMRLFNSVNNIIKGSDAVVLTVRHQPYLESDPGKVFEMVGKPFAIVECFGILDDTKIRRYFELKYEVKGLGRGRIQRIKEQVRGN